jgi:hypothetical protein
MIRLFRHLAYEGPRHRWEPEAPVIDLHRRAGGSHLVANEPGMAALRAAVGAEPTVGSDAWGWGPSPAVPLDGLPVYRLGDCPCPPPARDIYTFLTEFSDRPPLDLTVPQDRCTTPAAAGPARTAPTTTDPFPPDPRGATDARARTYFQSRPDWDYPTTGGGLRSRHHVSATDPEFDDPRSPL